MKSESETKSDPLIGRRVGVYELKRKLGGGAETAVYLAHRADGEFRQTAAVKLMHSADESSIERFRRERQIIASLDHPNIAFFLTGGSTADEIPYFVMEFVDGSPLIEFCSKDEVGLRDIISLTTRICDAVEAVHRQNIVHGDLNPENIIVKPGGSPKLLDFGSAVQQGTRSERRSDREYASPEQIAGKELTTASDVYSLGLIFYRLATGHSPSPANQGENGISIPVELSMSDEPLAADLKKIILKSLRKDPGERYASAAKLADDLRHFLAGEPIDAEVFPQKPRAVRKINENSVAILPFRMISPDASELSDEQFLGVGLADALVSRLSGTARLVVRPTSSVLPFAGTDPVAAGKKIGVRHILDGSIRRAGDRIRVTVQLLDVKKNASVWAEKFDEDFSDVLELEDRIAEKAAEILLPHLTGKERKRLEKRSTNEPRAYQAYLRGRYFANQFSDEALAKAFAGFERAIELDPGYSLPYIGIADLYVWSVIFGEIPSREGFPNAKMAIERALELDESLGEAYAILAFITLLYEWDWSEAEKLIETAIELNPNYFFAHEARAAILASQGISKSARVEIVLAEQLDPMSPRAKLMTSWIMYQTRNHAAAVSKARQANEMQEEFAQGLLHLGNALSSNENLEEAVKVLRRSVELWQNPGMPLYLLCFALAADGQPNAAREALNDILKLSEERFVMPYFIAMAYAAVGENDLAFDWFEKAVQDRNVWMIWFGTDPKLDDLRRDPRFEAIFAKTNNPLSRGNKHRAGDQPGRKRSIAVLPFQILNPATAPDPDDDYLSIGLADALTMRLSNVRRFIVRPTSSVLSFADSDSLRSGQRLNVDFVLEGNIRRLNKRIRVTAQVLNVQRNSTLWAERFDENVTDVLTLEDRISERVAKCLLPRLSGEEIRRLGKRGTDSPEAYEAYMRGRYFWNQFTSESFLKTIRELEKAVTIDPNYAKAHAAIADFYNWSTIYGLFPSNETAPLVYKSANRALEIDNSLAEAYSAIGLYYSGRCAHEKAEENYRRSVKLSPNYSLAHEWLAATLVGTGRFDEGLREIDLAERLDPLSLRAKTLTAWTKYQARRYQDSLKKACEIISLDPNNPQGYLQLSNVQIQLGMYPDAVENSKKAVEMMQPSPMPVYTYCFALAGAGDMTGARSFADELLTRSKSSYVMPYFIAMAHVAVNNFDVAFEFFERSLAENNQWLLWFATEPKLDIIRNDQRYPALLEKINPPMFKMLAAS